MQSLINVQHIDYVQWCSTSDDYPSFPLPNQERLPSAAEGSKTIDDQLSKLSNKRRSQFSEPTSSKKNKKLRSHSPEFSASDIHKNSRRRTLAGGSKKNRQPTATGNSDKKCHDRGRPLERSPVPHSSALSSDSDDDLTAAGGCETTGDQSVERSKKRRIQLSELTPTRNNKKHRGHSQEFSASDIRKNSHGRTPAGGSEKNGEPTPTGNKNKKCHDRGRSLEHTPVSHSSLLSDSDDDDSEVSDQSFEHSLAAGRRHVLQRLTSHSSDDSASSQYSSNNASENKHDSDNLEESAEVLDTG